jgi:Uri superfamily endonuclease
LAGVDGVNGDELAAGAGAQVGVYALEFALDRAHAVRIGRLGQAWFPAGEYVYVGSACGPGGLRARLGRHLRRGAGKKFHWHIDYLLPFAQPRLFCYGVVSPGLLAGCRRLECNWSQFLLDLPGASAAMKGFGASDCRSGCPAHLVAFAGRADWLPLAEPGVRSGLARAAGLLADRMVYQLCGQVPASGYIEVK